MVSRSFRFDHPVNLRLLLAPVKGTRRGGTRGLPEGMWWATRTPEGPATLRLVVQERTVLAEAWGSGADWVLDQTPALLGAEDDLAGFRPQGIVDELARRLRSVRIGQTDRYFEILVPTVIAQKVTTKAAGRSLGRLTARFGEPAPGPFGIMLPPSAERLASLPYFELHPLGIEQRRAGTLIGAASRADRIEEIGSMPKQDAYRRLAAFPGIGPWTAANVMSVAGGDADAVPIGDYHLPNVVSWALAGEPRGDDDRMLELLEPYRGHRGRVLRILKFSGFKAPAFGPRMAVREFEHQ